MPPFVRSSYHGDILASKSHAFSQTPEHGIFTLYAKGDTILPVVLLFTRDPDAADIVSIRHRELPSMLDHIPAHLSKNGLKVAHSHLDRFTILGGGFVSADHSLPGLVFFGQSNWGRPPTSLISNAFSPTGYLISFAPNYGDIAVMSANIDAQTWYLHHGFDLQTL